MSTTQILVVEDERLVAKAIQQELEQFGYEVPGIASSAKEAVQKADEHRPDLVLMDIHLDGESDGIEAARRIRNRWGIPVVYLSAFSDSATLARASDTEAFGYLLKPYEEQELHTTIEMALAKHRAEQQLAETERWLAAIHESINDAVLAADAGHQIRFMNFATEALTGWRKEDALGLSLAQVCNLATDNGPLALQELADQVASDARPQELPSSTRLVSKSGRQTPVEGTIAANFDSRGQFLGTVLTLRNISSRLELQRLQQQDEERLHRAQKIEALGRLADGLSRRLNNLLTVILGNTSLVLAECSNDPAQTEKSGLLQDVELAAQDAAELVQRLRMLSLFSGRSPSDLREVDLNLFIPECLNQIKPLLDSRTHFTYHAGPELWRVNVDELLLGQAILELALNSQAAMPHGGQIALELANTLLTAADLADHPHGQVGEFVRIQISDTGKGISPNLQYHLFDPLLSSHESSPTEGLGMVVILAVVEQHRGWIECHSQSGRGAQFDLYLPRHATLAPMTPADAGPAKSQGTPQTILLADADEMVRDLGRRILEAQGYRVLLAEDGVQAIAIFQQEKERIDLTILDLDMPRLATHVVLDRLVQLDPHVRVLFTGAYFAEDVASPQGHTRGVITKPFRQQELVERVQGALATTAS